ncbi:unnamed protein product, partial [Hapterophycus canaliculatus]
DFRSKQFLVDAWLPATQASAGKERKLSRKVTPPTGGRCVHRQLTKHVVTRWYRAPELILLQ